MPQPLPSQLPESLNHSHVVSEIRSAYSKILLLEQAAADADPKLRELRLVHARILGYLIREGPSIRAIEHVAKEVNTCRDNDQIDKIGEMYQLHFIRVFKKRKTITPSPSSHSSSCPSFETTKEMMQDILRQDDEAPEPNTKRRKALARDNFRCIVTGSYDDHSATKNRELEEEMYKTRTPPCIAQCTHIFPPSIDVDISGLDEDGVKREHAATLWTIMRRFGYEDLPEKLHGAGIHSLDNLMTLEYNIQIWFDELKLWFEAVDGKENTYNIRVTFDPILRSCNTNPIVFKSTHPDLPLPNPTYLKIHAACCRVAHLSGAGEYIGKILEDLENIPVLYNDGSSAHILSFALQPYGQEAVVQVNTC